MERRLAAILAADVVGFSRLMGKDDTGTLQRLISLRKELVQPQIKEHKGRTVKLMGDGLLAVFSSVVEAVQCAIDIQQAMTGREVDLPDDQRVNLRIGVNLGDIILESTDIYGDGVNVAARLESLAEPGGICISSVVREQIRHRVIAEFTNVGTKTLKNIAEPMEIWKWSPVDAHQRSFPIGRLPLPDKPSIAVLPFTNMSGDPDQEYFSDGISEDIITDLSKIASLFVIARNSSFAYKGTAINVRTVAGELGVQYLLEGSVRRADNRVRVTAQLIDANTGGHLWADRFDRELKDIFALQDDITHRIVQELHVTLSDEEQNRLADDRTTSVEAYDCFLRGREIIFGASRANLEIYNQSIAQFKRAIQIDPDYAIAYAELTRTYLLDYQAGWSGDPDRSLIDAGHTAELAIDKDNNEPFAHYAAAAVAIFKKDFERWSSEIQIALKFDPNFALANNALGLLHVFGGDPMDAIVHIERAMRLDPGYYQQYLHFLGTAFLVAGKYEDAVDLFKKRISLMPDTDLSRGLLAAALGHLGRTDEARQVWQELLQVNPEYSFEQHIERLPFKKLEDPKRIADGLHRADLLL
jgi:adenylate cyclase